MLDANFRLKLKQRHLEDPPLGGGLAYFVEQAPYMAHVKAAGPQTEVRHQNLLNPHGRAESLRAERRSMSVIQGCTPLITQTVGEEAHTRRAGLERANADIC